MLEQTTAAILAGGFGTRLRSVVSDRPKIMADVGGRPFVEYLLDQLAAAGVRSVVLCTGFMADKVESALGSSYKGMTLAYSRETDARGTGGALRLALPLLESEHVLAMNGDSFCDASLAELAAQHKASGGAGTIALTWVEDSGRYGRVDTDSQGRITQFSEKDPGAGPGWINAGIYLLECDLIASIEPNRAVSLEREVFPVWLARGIYAYRTDQRLWDIGVPEAYAEAASRFPK